jgi:hypothetical protein
MRFLIQSLIVTALLAPIRCIWAEEPMAPLNQLILEAMHGMPVGGGYSTSGTANRALNRAVSVGSGSLSVEAAGASPSYCSEATYLVFLKTLSLLENRKMLTLESQTLIALKPSGQPDGTGIWGRWNANGPGTARLFYELGLGTNFNDLSRARPGDFLKIFWNDGIGASEHGHSVIFLGTGEKNGVKFLQYWSSNIPGGYGEKSVPLSRARRLLFSRLEHPGNINRHLPRTDSYLSSLQHRSSSSVEMADQCGILR